VHVCVYIYVGRFYTVLPWVHSASVRHSFVEWMCMLLVSLLNHSVYTSHCEKAQAGNDVVICICICKCTCVCVYVGRFYNVLPRVHSASARHSFV
jgi:hypothetical protein